MSLIIPATQSQIAEWQWAGENYGYQTGGYSTNDQVEKHSYSSTSNATLVGTLTYARWGHGSGQSDTVNGFVFHMGGYGNITRITKNATAADATSIDIGVTSGDHGGGQAGSSSETHGYVWMGNDGGNKNIDKVAFASGTSGTDVGDVSTTGRYGASGQTAEDAIYCAGGYGTPTYFTDIQKRVTASDGDSASHGDLHYGTTDGTSGNSDPVNGYGFSAGGHNYNNIISKFAFAGTGVTGVSHGTLQTVRIRGSSGCTLDKGFYNGGSQTWATTLTNIRSYPLASTSGESNWGSAVLTTANAYASGTQY